MSVNRRRTLQLLTGLLLVAGLALAFAPEPVDREIVVVARDMAFFSGAPGGPSNPTLTVRVGERVRILLVNEDRGMVHDLAVEGLGLATRALTGDGSRDEVRFVAPRRPGRYEYVCTYHDRLMRGVLDVRP